MSRLPEKTMFSLRYVTVMVKNDSIKVSQTLRRDGAVKGNILSQETVFSRALIVR